MRFSATIAAGFTLCVIAASARAEECGREAFAAVVTDANSQLSSLNQDNKKSFQEKLQLLKTRSGWSDRDYVTQATPYVQDERIAAFDTENKALLAKIPQLGGGAPETTQALAGAPAAASDARCAMLKDLRGLIGKVIENTQAKWRYMAGKIDGAIEKAPQAQAAR